MAQLREGFERLVDFYRTAWFGETLLVLSLYNVISSYNDIIEDGKLGAIVAVTGLASIGYVVKQFRLRSRLEHAVNKYGYEDRIFKPALGKFCDYQTAYVAAKRTNCLEDFLELVDRESSK